MNNWTPIFDDRFQRHFVAWLVRDTHTLMLVRDFVIPAHFSNEVLQGLVRLTLNYYDRYGVAPDEGLLDYIGDIGRKGGMQETTVALYTTVCRELLQERLQNRDFILDRYDEILKHIAFPAALQQASEYGKKGDFNEAVDHLVKEMSKTPRAKKPTTRKSLAELIEMKNSTPLQDVVVGLHRRRELLQLVAHPKARKSWLAQQLGICVVTGKPFLGLPTVQGRVRIFDFEMFDQDNGLRGEMLARRCGIDPDALTGILEYDQLYQTDYDIDYVEQSLRADGIGKWSLAIIDSQYRIMPPGVSENDPEFGYTLRRLTRLAGELDIAILLVHHVPKGASAEKQTWEVAAGHSVQARSTYGQIVLRPHADSSESLVLDTILRGQKPLERMALTWRDGLWEVDRNLNPNNLKTAGKPKATAHDIAPLLPRKPATVEAANNAMGKKELLAYLKKQLPQFGEDSLKQALGECLRLSLAARWGEDDGKLSSTKEVIYATGKQPLPDAPEVAA